MREYGVGDGETDDREKKCPNEYRRRFRTFHVLSIFLLNRTHHYVMRGSEG